ncbi:MAG: insulinase family protein [Clostridia bacterium]|nr:insulinase family protein [Clostridia bacterium]
MDQFKKVDLASGVEGFSICTDRFKTSRISVNMFVPLRKETVSANALLSCLLTRATRKYPTYTHLNAKLDELYGAALYGDVAKVGDMQMLKFVIAVLDDKYTLNGEVISGDATELLLSMIFDPLLNDEGLFDEKDFESEKRLLVERIKGEINEKRIYAIKRTEGEMCKNEPYGLPKYGTLEDAQALTNADVVNALKYAVDNAFIRVNVISESYPEAVFQSVSEFFKDKKRTVTQKDITKKHIPNDELIQISEKMDVTQAKLCMGFSADFNDDLQSRINARVTADLFGGGPYSRLFKTVREEQSLCYYCAARINLKKRILMVDSGILEENKEKAYNGILEQLSVLQQGKFDESELLASKMALMDSAKTVCDTPAELDGWYTAYALYDTAVTTDEFVEKINNVTKQDVIDIANSIKLDTVYFLGSENFEKGE